MVYFCGEEGKGVRLGKLYMSSGTWEDQETVDGMNLNSIDLRVKGRERRKSHSPFHLCIIVFPPLSLHAQARTSGYHLQR